ncbi:MAG TPA: Hsp20/alpha crystallin family protein [Spirochaetia bacterium]|nr:Hsp20/alpha crystallin family protein [Spirochaetia bacterium]
MKSLIQYQPSYLDMFGDLDRVFNSLVGGSSLSSARMPAVDIREEEDRYVLEAELTGLTEKDVEVKVQDNLLMISSKKEHEAESKKNGYVLKERRSSAFSRSFVLPKDVNREEIEASFKNGLLTLTLHKSPETQPRAIEVKASK